MWKEDVGDCMVRVWNVRVRECNVIVSLCHDAIQGVIVARSSKRCESLKWCVTDAWFWYSKCVKGFMVMVSLCHNVIGFMSDLWAGKIRINGKVC